MVNYLNMIIKLLVNYQNKGDYWEENNIEKPQQIIVCAANKMSNSVILCGARHWDSLMRQQSKAMRIKFFELEQCFVDQFGTFITREEAMKIVLNNGQPFNIHRNGGSTIKLFSEGLY